MFLGIEIGGTKLQLGASSDGRELAELVRRDVDPARQADGIREQIVAVGRELIEKHEIERIGIGFGGPVDHDAGRVRTSHQVEGWTDFPFVQWCSEELGRPVVLGNDCDVAALAESRFGAGSGKPCTFYITVGTGIGGGLVYDGRSFGENRPAIAEIGHLRPGLEATHPKHTVEQLAAGPGIARRFQMRLDVMTDQERQRYDGEDLTGKRIAELAQAGDEVAGEVIDETCRVLGWAVAQVVTLVAPQVVVIGGGVSLIGEPLFFEPVRQYADGYVFPPLAGSFDIVPAQLGEEVVVHGACALAASATVGRNEP